MVAAIKQIVTVQAGGHIEIHAPQLEPGTQAEVIVLIDTPASGSDAKASASDAASAWREFRAVGERLAATSVASAPSLTGAVSQLRR